MISRRGLLAGGSLTAIATAVQGQAWLGRPSFRPGFQFLTNTLPTFVYEAETQAIITAKQAAGETVNTARAYLLNKTVKRLKAAGIWALATANAARSRLVVFPNENGGTASLINWFAPGTGDAIIVGTPTFTTQRGYSQTVSGNYIRTTVSLQQLSQNDVHLSLFANNSVTTNAVTDFGAIDSGSNGLTLCVYNNATASATGRCMSAFVNGFANGPIFSGGNGTTILNRSVSTGFDSGKGGYYNATATQASVAMATNVELLCLTLGGAVGAGSGRIIRGYLLCPGLTQAQYLEAHAAITTYMDAVRFGEPEMHDPGVQPQNVTADAIILGLTPSAIVAAYTAARRGVNVVLVGGERDRTLANIGGMSAGGLGFTDSFDFTSIGGVPRAMYTWINTLTGRSDTSNQTQMSPNCQEFNWVCRRMLDPNRTGTLPGQNVPIYFAGRVQTVYQDATSGIYTVTTADGRTFKALSFIDNTDSQESFLPLGIPFKYGSEASGTGAEAQNGYQGTAGFKLPTKKGTSTTFRIDPYVTPATPASGYLPFVTDPPSLATGAADPTTQSTNFRLSLTNDVTNQAPWDTTPPPNYNALNYEAMGRFLAQDNTLTISYVLNGPNYLSAGTAFADFNTSESFPIGSTDVAGSGTAWVNAQLTGTTADRETEWKKRENYTRGLIYWIMFSGDSRIPAAVKTAFTTTFKLCSGFYLDPHPNDRVNWMPMLYVRACLRLDNTFNLNGNDTAATDGTTPRSIKTIATGSYAADDHGHYFVAYDDGTGNGKNVFQAGGYFDTTQGGTDKRSPIPIEVLLTDPGVANGSGFATATGAGGTQVAYSVMRMEPTRMEMGQAIGEMIYLRKQGAGTDFHNLSYSTLRTNILGGGDAVAPVLPQTN